VYIDENAAAVGDNAPSFTLDKTLIVNQSSAGWTIDTAQYSTWAITQPFVFTNVSYSPALTHANITGEQTTDPGIGTCKVLLPGSSAAGIAGVGAHLVAVTANGVTTSTPLWTPGFPCGAQVAGLNDVEGTSCFDVHTRLNVNANGCTLEGLPPTPGVQAQRQYRRRTFAVGALPY
jgi:hypothetical protein